MDAEMRRVVEEGNKIMRRAFWNWLMHERWQVDPKSSRPACDVMDVTDAEICTDLRRILLPRRKFLGLF